MKTLNQIIKEFYVIKEFYGEKIKKNTKRTNKRTNKSS